MGSFHHSRAELGCLVLEHGCEIGSRTWIDLRERRTKIEGGPELSAGDFRERARQRGARAQMVVRRVD
jgi:hypothetical protein